MTRSIKEEANTFTGFALKPKMGDWKLYNNHMFETICREDKNMYSWLLSWMAHIVQNPVGTRVGVCPILRGEQGTGKGCFVNLFGKIFGNDFVPTCSLSNLASRFNGRLKDRILMFMDDDSWENDGMVESAIKDLITEDRLLIEERGKVVLDTKNHLNLIMASSGKRFLSLGYNNRRFKIFTLSNNHKSDHEYFAAIFDQMLKMGGCEAMLYDLLRMNISKFHSQFIAPTSSDATEPAQSKRGEEWAEFSKKVADHIETYTIPQYGDKGDDRLTDDEPRDLVREIKKYILRHGRNSREDQDALDLVKIAHYACVAHAKVVDDAC